MKKFFILLLLTFFSCNKENKNGSTKEKGIEREPKKEIKFVNAKTGLIYRDKPKGKRLGKFDFNQQIEITNRTGIFQVIKNRNIEIKGEWVEVINENKKVFVFDGFLVDNKQNINFELAKSFLRGAIWVSEDYKNLLEQTKSNAKTFSQLQFYSDIIYDEKVMGKPILICDKNFQEPDFLQLDEKLNIDNKFKIQEISNTKMSVNKDGEIYKFFKSDIKTKGEKPYFETFKGSNSVFLKWFQGNYIIKGTSINKAIINSNLIRNYMHDDEENQKSYDIMEYNNILYRVDTIIENNYHLSQIKQFDGAGETLIPTGQKITLTKLKK